MIGGWLLTYGRPPFFQIIDLEMKRIINIVSGLTLWVVCILILVDPTDWLTKQTPWVGVPILIAAGVFWTIGSMLLTRAVDDIEYIDGDE